MEAFRGFPELAKASPSRFDVTYHIIIFFRINRSISNFETQRGTILSMSISNSTSSSQLNLYEVSLQDEPLRVTILVLSTSNMIIISQLPSASRADTSILGHGSKGHYKASEVRRIE